MIMIINKTGNIDIFYTIATEHGILDSKYRTGELEVFHGDIKIDEETLKQWRASKKTISLREVARIF